MFNLQQSSDNLVLGLDLLEKTLLVGLLSFGRVGGGGGNLSRGGCRLRGGHQKHSKPNDMRHKTCCTVTVVKLTSKFMCMLNKF